jgi:hypothetical protein
MWPRSISSFTTEGRQILVYSREEALSRFRQANFLDCRINAYPFHEDWAIKLFGQAPDFIFIDLDLFRFKSSKQALDSALRSTLENIRKQLDGAQPTVLWSGRGYHIYISLKAFILELESVFAEFGQPSKEFLGFAEQYLSNKKADPSHSNGLSFKNCLLRIPGSYNSKNAAEVKIIQRWDGTRHAINWLLRDYRRYLIQEKINGAVNKKIKSNYSRTAKTILRERPWIEILLETPIGDYRKNAVWRILAPYLINIKKLSYEEAFYIIKKWLNTCDKIIPLDFSANTKIKDTLRAASRVGYLPMGFKELKTENEELYRRISSRIGTVR